MPTLEIQVLSVHAARCGGQFLSVSYPKMSTVSISVPHYLHSCSRACRLLAVSEDLRAFKGLKVSRTPAQLLSGSMSIGQTSRSYPLQLTACTNKLVQDLPHQQWRGCSALCYTSRCTSLSSCTTSQTHMPECNSHTLYLSLPNTPVQEWGSRMRPKCWKFPRSSETNWNASQFCSRMIALAQ